MYVPFQMKWMEEHYLATQQSKFKIKSNIIHYKGGRGSRHTQVYTPDSKHNTLICLYMCLPCFLKKEECMHTVQYL